jgi:hypothetical protein
LYSARLYVVHGGTWSCALASAAAPGWANRLIFALSAGHVQTSGVSLTHSATDCLFSALRATETPTPPIDDGLVTAAPCSFG